MPMGERKKMSIYTDKYAVIERVEKGWICVSVGISEINAIENAWLMSKKNILGMINEKFNHYSTQIGEFCVMRCDHAFYYYMKDKEYNNKKYQSHVIVFEGCVYAFVEGIVKQIIDIFDYCFNPSGINSIEAESIIEDILNICNKTYRYELTDDIKEMIISTAVDKLNEE